MRVQGDSRNEGYGMSVSKRIVLHPPKADIGQLTLPIAMSSAATVEQ
jgi:hypothetical protein